MVVCRGCLQAIESHEGKQIKRDIEFDDERITDDNKIFCQWCEEYVDSCGCVEI